MVNIAWVSVCIIIKKKKTMHKTIKSNPKEQSKYFYWLRISTSNHVVMWAEVSWKPRKCLKCSGKRHTQFTVIQQTLDEPEPCAWYKTLIIWLPFSLIFTVYSIFLLNLSTGTTNRAPKSFPVTYLKLCVTVDFIFAFTHFFGIPVFRYCSILESNLL